LLISLQIYQAGGASLFSVLNQCRTPMGSRRLLRLIKQPLLRCEHITRRHDLVDAFCQDTALTHSLLVKINFDSFVSHFSSQDDNFKRMPDVTRLMRKLLRQTYATLQVWFVYLLNCLTCL
jgi:DNA mismatch repair protein MSH2